MTTPQEAKNYLSVCEQEKWFVLKTGEPLKNLHQLSFALEEMPEEVFLYHSNQKKCDFSNWIWEVVGDKKLAVELYIKRGHKSSFQETLNNRIRELEELAMDLS